jgi:hypothetical protein
MEDLEKKYLLNFIVWQHIENMSRMVKDPNGQNPACKNALFTWICENCGRDVRYVDKSKACPASKPEDRWSFR